MITKEFVEDIVSDLKKSANKAYEKNKYDEVLSLVSICAAVLYQTNIYYRDDDLENLLGKVASNLLAKHISNYCILIAFIIL